MFDESLPGPDTVATLDDAELCAAIAGWAATSAAADARKLAAIAELHRRATTGLLRERDAVDDTDAAAAQISCALTISHGNALAMIDLATTLRDRLPQTAARYLAGQISPTLITTIAYRTFLVTPTALPAIDTAIAERAHRWGTLTRHQLSTAIDTWIHRHDPDAVRRTRNAMRGRYFTIDTQPRAGTDPAAGTVTVHGRLTGPDAALARARQAEMQAHLCPDDPRTQDQRNADAAGASLAGFHLLACACDNPDCPGKTGDGYASHITIHVLTDPESLYAEPDPHYHGHTPPASRDEHTSPEPEEAAPKPAPTPKPPAPVQDRPAVIAGGGIVPAPLLAELIARGATIRLINPDTLTTEPRYRPSTALDRFIRTRDMTCRLHHLIKTFLPGWADTQHPDGAITITTPTGTRCTTKPLSTLLFPNWRTTTPPPTPTDQPSPPTTPGRHLKMPTRRHTRTHNRATYITRERRLNNTERKAEHRRRTIQPTPGASPRPNTFDTPDHPPDYGNDPPPF
ncbi:DUF222 domain-containing protein [Mycolicibacterium parafortuitum]|uniref:DUF222 domain-containing protein n=1 Tax=Mycolicibacterium parafortuitum TaxID=39692 RepID=A0A375YFI7_MYCPF|nr:DUF222 domain-containing protein [Mycolicibacterium parafortuitum]SRX79829.1 hypothetical protein MPP7335_01567 [Mycolicibacterium parafortuitum]